MKIAYLVSRYPAVSHTFILREVRALRTSGVEIGTFSIRRADRGDVLGEDAENEAKTTRWLVPSKFGWLCQAFLWALLSRPIWMCQTLLVAVARPSTRFRQRLKWFAYFGEAILLAYWLVRDGYEHLHCHFGNNGSSTGMLAARLAGMPFSFTCHGSELLDPVKFRLDEKVAEACFVACVSQHGRGQLMLSCSPEHWYKLRLVPCGLPAAEKPSSHENGCSSEILCVGRLSPEKGHFVLLSALAALRDRGISFHCTLVGEGAIRKRIEKRIEELKLTKHVRLTGSLPPDRVAALYESAGVVVLSSFTEGVPVVLMEALAHARPVIATRVGGVSELIEHGTRGLLVAPGDADGMADALSRVLSNPRLARSLGENGCQFLQQHYCLEVSTQLLIDLFHRSIHGTDREARTFEKATHACQD